jgi:hypothetical protein
MQVAMSSGACKSTCKSVVWNRIQDECRNGRKIPQNQNNCKGVRRLRLAKFPDTSHFPMTSWMIRRIPSFSGRGPLRILPKPMVTYTNDLIGPASWNSVVAPPKSAPSRVLVGLRWLPLAIDASPQQVVQVQVIGQPEQVNTWWQLARHLAVESMISINARNVFARVKCIVLSV